MDASTAAFAAPLAAPWLSARAPVTSLRSARRSVPARTLRRPLRMVAEPEAEPTSSTDPATSSDAVESAKSALNLMREEVSRENIQNETQTGVYRDVDGRSNVFALEPLESVDEKPQINKAAILAAVFAAVAFALVVLPNLPLTNADQF